jgi:hypothetical protein
MANITLVACSKSKASRKSSAAALYRSPLFRKSLLYALSQSGTIYILSAKYGLLTLSETIEPYDVTLKSLSVSRRAEWAAELQLSQKITKKDKAVVLAGRDYYDPLMPHLLKIGCQIDLPLHNQSFGHRLRCLKHFNNEIQLASDVYQFYDLIHCCPVNTRIDSIG